MTRKLLFPCMIVLAASTLLAGLPPKSATSVERQVRHELIMLPYYGIFDNLVFQVEGNRVILSGQVTSRTLKSDAEDAVKTIEGVGSVENRIEVLPFSPNDERIRRAAYRAVFAMAPLQRYQMSAVPSIHIVVRNGNITLEGVANNEAERNMAEIGAKGAHGALGVRNNLRIEK